MGHLAGALLVVALGAVPVLAAQGAPTPACALLSVAEVRTITGRQNYPDHVDGDPDGEGFGGGSSCQYGGLSMSRSRRSAPLYVKAGTNELIVQMDVEPPATEASVRPIVIAIAQAAVLKLR